jgi:hypothetical protein
VSAGVAGAASEAGDTAVEDDAGEGTVAEAAVAAGLVLTCGRVDPVKSASNSVVVLATDLAVVAAFGR